MTGYTRDVVDFDRHGDRFKSGPSELVTVVFDDDRHTRFEVTTDSGGELSSLTVVAPRIDQRLMRMIPLGYLREAAAGYRSEVDEIHESGGSVVDAIDAASGDAAVFVAPSLEEFARVWQETSSAITPGGDRVTRRRYLADYWHVSVWTIDKWTRAARDGGVIPPANTGRPRDEELRTDE